MKTTRCPNCDSLLRQEHSQTNKRYCFNCGWKGYLVSAFTLLQESPGRKQPVVGKSPVKEEAVSLCAPSTSTKKLVCEKRSYEIFDVLPDSFVLRLRQAGVHVSYYGSKRIGPGSTVLRW